MNYFGFATSAERYAAARPYFQPLVVEKIRETMRLEAPLNWALDVGCGTGNSTRALREIAARVVGTDISQGMLAQAPREAGLFFVEAPAEQLPFADGSFDLLTVSMALHWFDRGRFLTEAYRVLRSGGWLVIVNHGHAARMRGNGAYEQWHNEVYRARFPAPERPSYTLSEAEASEFGFLPRKMEHFSHELSYTMEKWVTYLTTQSGVIAAVEGGKASIEEARGWLLRELTPFFAEPVGAFEFSGAIGYFQKQD